METRAASRALAVVDAVEVPRVYLYDAKGDFERAIDDYTEAIRLDPNRLMAYNIRGSIWGMKQETAKALDDFSAVISADPGDPAAYFNRARVWASTGELDKAIDDLTAVIRIGSHRADASLSRPFLRSKGDREKAFAEVYLHRGDLRLKKKEVAAAEEDFGEALRIDPALADARVLRGNLRYDAARFDDAMGDYAAAIKNGAQDAKVYDRRVEWLQEKGELDKALSEFNEALRVDPDNQMALWYRHKVLLAKGNEEHAGTESGTLVPAPPLFPPSPLLAYSRAMNILLAALGVSFAAFCVWLGVRIINRRERWAKWTLAVAIGLPVLYVASFGPAGWAFSRVGGGDDADYILAFIYHPIVGAWYDDPGGIGGIIDWYANVGAVVRIAPGREIDPQSRSEGPLCVVRCP